MPHNNFKNKIFITQNKERKQKTSSMYVLVGCSVWTRGLPTADEEVVTDAIVDPGLYIDVGAAVVVAGSNCCW